MQLEITKEELYTMMKSAVRDVLKEDSIKRILDSVPYVSDEEMEDIEKSFGKAPDPTNETAYTKTITI
jgi:hypothetical protein